MARLFTLLAVMCAVAGPARAAGDAAEGQRIAEQWCFGCHAVGAAGTDAAPPFTEVAKRAGRTDDYFYVWLTDPHPPMPRLDLSRQDIADLIAYLRSLPSR